MIKTHYCESQRQKETGCIIMRCIILHVIVASHSEPHTFEFYGSRF